VIRLDVHLHPGDLHSDHISSHCRLKSTDALSDNLRLNFKNITFQHRWSKVIWSSHSVVFPTYRLRYEAIRHRIHLTEALWLLLKLVYSVSCQLVPETGTTFWYQLAGTRNWYQKPVNVSWADHDSSSGWLKTQDVFMQDMRSVPYEGIYYSKYQWA